MLTGGERVVARCDQLGFAPYSDMADGLYRSYLSPAYIAAQRQISDWMEQAGMTVRIDGAGNLIGRYDGLQDGPPLVIGSHLDSVRDAGRYDGPLGIMLGIECVADFHDRQVRFSFPIEIYAFGDEEGSRFPAAMLTSRAVAGTLDPAMLAIKDAAGISLDAALEAYPLGALSSAGFADARLSEIFGYLEAHIEQGPALEAMNLPVGVVTGIAAQLRYKFTVLGRAGHAGTNSMRLRRDALAASAAMLTAAEGIAGASGDGVVATVGQLEVRPGAPNVVPGEVRFTLDVRAPTNGQRDTVAADIMTAFARIARERGVALSREALQDLAASPCDPAWTDMLASAAQDMAVPCGRLISGAGHDAMIMAALGRTAMLFIRCEGGISHNPAEGVQADDVELARRVMIRFVEKLEG
ncbi:allantoate amidohydrolase [Sphingobium sp. Ndbn-10]|jgi:allantoate deiminase|uniref:allantoate amidohydrolase n=1 Tax=Sphingobium sp. Ndbn-10 TaxID=1667223 RepID=UPI000818BD91|nr:allantoate amidohydrolase [Sphingobium sp. Ndbn-10]